MTDQSDMRLRLKRLFIPLIVKIVILTSVLIIGVSLILAMKNADLFSQISKDREEANAELLTSSKALEVEAILDAFTERLSTLSLEKNVHSLGSDLMYFKLNADGQDSTELNASGMSPEMQTTFQEIITSYKGEEEQIRRGKLFITSTGASLKEPYLILGAPVAKEDSVVTHWAWGAFKLNRLQASFENNKNIKTYLIDSRGHVIVHPDEKLTLKAADLSQSKIISSLLKSDVAKKQHYQNEILFSSARTNYGPYVVGEVSQASILAPSKLVKETSYYILGLVLSVSFFISFIFSHGLSRNLEKLTEFSRRIALGDFTVDASQEIKSHDEMGILAVAFDDMTEGLRERDRIKSLFTKFHGTAITEELLNQEDMRKGKQCEAVVFFSDIRGFTEFSKNKSPEEVVTMLNSYFEIMIRIINKHGGVVDKFVGDAIMAIWGAPNGTPDDAKKAVEACLEMRRTLEWFNLERLENGETPIIIGMGLHAGPVVAGTVGSNARLEYTVIGDTVNTASRIEAATKVYGTDLLISEEVVRRLDEQFIVTNAGETKVKGKDQPLRLAKVTGFYDEDGNAHIVATRYSQYEPEESDKAEAAA